MSLVTVIAIALGLAMDAFAVSIARGVAMSQLRLRQAFGIALSFGLFQAGMPVIGWLSGKSVLRFMGGLDHWLAFALLVIIGSKMIYEGVRDEESNGRDEGLGLWLLVTLSVTTSIDALVVGFSFALLSVPILAPAVIIGMVTFILSLAGVFIGNRAGHIFRKKAGILGGIILVAIGVKILIEHLVARA